MTTQVHVGKQIIGLAENGNMIKLIPILRQILTKEIDAEEAVTELGAIQTVIDGKRDVGAVAFANMPKNTAVYINDLIDEYRLKRIKVPSNPYELYIIFRSGAESQAQELLGLAEKYNGYFSSKATEEDSRRIGQLLGYKQSDIDSYIERNKRMRNNESNR